MKRTMMLLPILLSATYALPAQADPFNFEEDTLRLCSGASAKDWGDQKEIEQQVVDLGYTLINVRIEKGCWEVKAFDAQNEVYEFYIDPLSKEIVLRKHKADEQPPQSDQ